MRSPGLSVTKLLEMLRKKQKNKYTMVYFLFLKKCEQNRLTSDEKKIISDNEKYWEGLQSTASDLVIEQKKSTSKGRSIVTKKNKLSELFASSKGKPSSILKTNVTIDSIERSMERAAKDESSLERSTDSEVIKKKKTFNISRFKEGSVFDRESGPIFNTYMKMTLEIQLR